MKSVWLGLGLCALLLGLVEGVGAQPATPIPVNPPTATAPPPPPTDVPTRTPTSEGPASAEAINAGTNIRARPDISGDLVAQIAPGTRYPILGRYFEWYQIAYQNGPGGRAWVHQSVVTIYGDQALIPEISDPAGAGAESLPLVATPTGGLPDEGAGIGLPTAANALGAPIPLNTLGTPEPAAALPATAFSAALGGLPTYTPPAETPTPLNLADFTAPPPSSALRGGLPPIAPIAGLLGIGAAGLFLSALRRGG